MYDAIVRCRTPEAGGHRLRCAPCGTEAVVYHSCRNRHCPRCQSWAQHAWLEGRLERLLPVPHFHVVFTLPAELRTLAHRNRRAVYDVLFQAASETLLTLGRQRLGATLGVTAVLHTWTRALTFHPHLHCVVTGGGLALEGTRWVAARSGYLFPVAVVRTLFRGKVLAALRERAGTLVGYDPAVLATLRARDWVVYLQRPFAGAEAVFAYLGRYTHRVGISEARLVRLQAGRVTFRTRGDQRLTLPVNVFVGRFLDHVLPDGFRKIRHYGLLAPNNVGTKLRVAERWLRKPPRAPLVPVADTRPAREVCPRCGEARIRLDLRPRALDPPTALAAVAA